MNEFVLLKFIPPVCVRSRSRTKSVLNTLVLGCGNTDQQRNACLVRVRSSTPPNREVLKHH